MKRISTFLALSFALSIPACDEPVDEDNEDLEVLDPEFRALNHPSGICRIESENGYSHKRVLYYHKALPQLEHFRDYCDLWVGTAECCKQRNPFGLSYDQCAQLRHAPDCPKLSGGGGGGIGDGPPKQQH